jgi:hypothetical protein
LPPGQAMWNIEGKKIPVIAFPGWAEADTVGGLHPGNYGDRHHDDDPRDREDHHHDDLNAPGIHFVFCVFDLQCRRSLLENPYLLPKLHANRL